jgi:hypothetical protein
MTGVAMAGAQRKQQQATVPYIPPQGSTAEMSLPLTVLMIGWGLHQAYSQANFHFHGMQ